jgi:dethiobiotin synthetase
MNALVITGTDAGVGKTWVGRALGAALARAGRRVVAVKPVETGCGPYGDECDDGALLALATGQTEPREALYRYAARLDPALAAEPKGEPIDLDALLLRIEGLCTEAELLLVEGTGGMLTPITWEWTVAELARSLGAGMLVVGEDRAGAISQVLLTLSAVELAGLELAGVVLTTPERPDAATGTTAAAVARLAGLDRVIALPRGIDPADAGEAMVPVIGWVDRVGGRAVGG